MVVGLTVPWRSAGNRLGCFSIALDTAAGNIAIARDYAMGHLALAAQVNGAVPDLKSLLPSWYFQGGDFLQHNSLWINFIWITPLFLQWRIVKKQKSSAASVNNAN